MCRTYAACASSALGSMLFCSGRPMAHLYSTYTSCVWPVSYQPMMPGSTDKVKPPPERKASQESKPMLKRTAKAKARARVVKGLC